MKLLGSPCQNLQPFATCMKQNVKRIYFGYTFYTLEFYTKPIKRPVSINMKNPLQNGFYTIFSGPKFSTINDNSFIF